jgi:uncharacterized protein (TIGR03000 family)
MYEIVLMAAMTSAPEMVDRCGRGRCGCNGCSGCYSGCYCGGGWCGGYCRGGYCGGGWCGGGYCGGGYCGGWSGCSGCGGVWIRPGGERIGPPTKKDKEEEARRPAPATLIVSLPAGARLLVDEQPTTSTSAQRVFVSPPLERGYDYTYNLTATMQRDGQPVSTTQRVTVRAGQSVRVNLEVPAAATAAASD